MSRNILSNLHRSYPEHQSGFPLCVCTSTKQKIEDTNNQPCREVKNAVIRQGNEPTDILIDFKRVAVNAVKNQMPQLQGLCSCVDSFSNYKCSRYCCFIYFEMGFSGESMFGMLFSRFYVIRNHFIRNQLVDFE